MGSFAAAVLWNVLGVDSWRCIHHKCYADIIELSLMRRLEQKVNTEGLDIYELR